VKILGVNCLNHDAAITVIEDREILFAAHSERYSRKKNDKFLNDAIVNEALSFGTPDKIVYYEKPYLKKSRQLVSGQWSSAFSSHSLPKPYLKKWFNDKVQCIDHHLSHAAAGFLTSTYDEAVVVVIDGIGEWDVCTIWHGAAGRLKKIKSISILIRWDFFILP